MHAACKILDSAMGYEAFMDGNGDVEGDYALVALNPLGCPTDKHNFPYLGNLHKKHEGKTHACLVQPNSPDSEVAVT